MIKLKGSFWGLTTFFNPAGYRNKYENYRIFRENSKKQGLKLLAVELAFGNKPFELKKEDAEILIQIRGNKNNIMWQKERMLNIGLERLPKDCDKIAWLDADVIFKNDNWVNETSKLLEKYAIIQPFSWAVRLPKGKKDMTYKEFIKLKCGNEDNTKIGGICHNVSKKGKKILKEDFIIHGHTGFAWAAHRKLIEKFKFYDRSIIYNGDSLMTKAFLKHEEQQKVLSKHTTQNYLNWAKKVSKENNTGIFYTNGFLLHLWHGNNKNRFYGKRISLLNDIFTNFDPKKDIKVDKNGLWAWSSKKPELHKGIEDYFLIRNEDGSAIFELIKQFKDYLQRIRNKNIIENAKNKIKNKSKKNIYRFNEDMSKKTNYLKINYNIAKERLRQRYHYTLGSIGPKIKDISPSIYLYLKKYFPDK